MRFRFSSFRYVHILVSDLIKRLPMPICRFYFWFFCSVFSFVSVAAVSADIWKWGCSQERHCTRILHRCYCCCCCEFIWIKENSRNFSFLFLRYTCLSRMFIEFWSTGSWRWMEKALQLSLSTSRLHEESNRYEGKHSNSIFHWIHCPNEMRCPMALGEHASFKTNSNFFNTFE